MKLKSVLQICIIFALLLGVVLFSNQEEKKKEEVAQMTKELLVLDKEKVDGLSIQTDSGTVVLRKEAGAWKITEPLALQASEGAVQGVLANLERAHLNKFLLLEEGEETERLTEYGLLPPKIRVIVEVEGAVLDTIDYGISPLNVYVYVKKASENRVGMTELYRRTGVDKDLRAMREKRALVFEKSAVTQWRIAGQAATIEVAREPEGWRLQQPSMGPADGAQVDSVLSHLGSAFMSFVDDTPVSLAPFGLDSPTVQIDVHVQSPDGSPAKHTLWIGDETDGGHFAKSTSGPSVFSLDSSFVQSLPTSDFPLRPKRLVDFQRRNVDRIEFVYPDRSILCVRDNDAWLAVSPAQPVDGAEIETILFALERLEAIAFVENSRGLEPARLRIRAWAGEMIVADLALGDEQDGEVHARGGAIESGCLVDKAATDRLMPERIFVAE